MTRHDVFLALRDGEGRTHRRHARDRVALIVNHSGLAVEAMHEARLARGDRFTHPDLGPVEVLGVESFALGKSEVAA